MTGVPEVRRTSLLRLPALRALLALTLLAFSSFFLTLSALPSWAVRGGAVLETAGAVTAAMLTATVLAQGLVPLAARRFGAAPVLAFGLVALGAPTPLLLVDQGLGWLSAVSVVRGAGFAVVTVLGAALTARLAPPERRGEGVGLYGLVIAVPNLLAVPGGVALTLSGHFAVVALLGLAPLLALPLVGAIARGARAAGDDRAGPPGPVTRAEVIGVAVPSLMLLVVTLAGGGLFTFLPIAAPSGPRAVVALALFGIAAAACRWGSGLAADRVGTRLLMPLGQVAAVVGCAGVAAGLGTDDAVLLAAGALVFGVGYGAVQNLTLVEAFARTPRHGGASAAWNASFDTGTAVGALAVGIVAAGTGIAGAYLVCAVVVAATIPLVALLRR